MAREPELYKDKIEVSLDGRQIFYLFFGGAVIVGMVFVLGVMVGRRVEARGHVDHARTTTAADPLAALDRLEPRPETTYQQRLAPNPTSPTNEVEKKIEELAKTREAKKVDKADKTDKADKAEKKPDDSKAAKKPEAKPEKKPASEAANPDVITALDKPLDEKKPDKSEKSEKADKSEKKGKFTLQLSSFQDKSEAESFLSSVKAAGYQAYVTEAEVTGKGTFYRVRLGSYRSMDAANDAKADVEKAIKKTASVMRL